MVTKNAAFLGIEITDTMLRQIDQPALFEMKKAAEFTNMHEVGKFNTFYRKCKIGICGIFSPILKTNEWEK